MWKTIAHDKERDRRKIYPYPPSSNELRKKGKGKNKERIKSVRQHLFQAE